MFFEACLVTEVPSDKSLRCKLDGVSVLILKDSQENIYALKNVCSHADLPLHAGPWNPTTCELVCPAHGAKFDICHGGAVTLGPAVLPLEMYRVEVRNNASGKLAVFVEMPEEED